MPERRRVPMTYPTREGTPVPVADFEAAEEAADAMLAREAEAVLAAEDGPTVTMADVLADLFTGRGGETA
jgi:hypothetical protein